MRTAAVVLAASLTALGPRSAPAQHTFPHLVVSAGLGALTAGGGLWHLPAQLATAPNNQYDTVSLGRSLNSGLMAVAGSTWFPGDHLGYSAEIGQFGLGSTGACAPAGTWVLDSEHKNEQACSAINGNSLPTSVFAVQGGLTLRIGPARAVVPYVRATSGFAFLESYFVQSEAVVASKCGWCTLILLEERSRPQLTWVATLAAGNTVYGGPGYSFRLEVRDLIASLPVATDSGTPTSTQPFPYAKLGRRVRHTFGFLLALDVNLERSHRRRY